MSTDKEKQESIIAKIKALLRKAQGGTTDAEMQMLMAKAQELATKYQVDLANIDPNSEEFEVNETVFMESVRLTNEVKFAANIVREFFNVYTFLYTIYVPGSNKSRHQVRVVGTEADQAIAKFVFDFLVMTFRDLWNTALRQGRFHIQDRHIFMLGLYNGVLDRLHADKAAQNQERAVMVIGNKLAQRKKFVEEKHPDLKDVKTHSNEGSMTAYADGYEKGRKLQIRKGVTAPERATKGELA